MLEIPEVKFYNNFLSIFVAVSFPKWLFPTVTFAVIILNNYNNKDDFLLSSSIT